MTRRTLFLRCLIVFALLVIVLLLGTPSRGEQSCIQSGIKWGFAQTRGDLFGNTGQVTGQVPNTIESYATQNQVSYLFDTDNGPLFSFGCREPRLICIPAANLPVLECPPSAGFSCNREITRIWLINEPYSREIGDMVWWNDSPTTVYVSAVEIVPEPSSITLLLIGIVCFTKVYLTCGRLSAKI
jgi:hypothetical protein